MLCRWGGDFDAVSCWSETSGLDKDAIAAVMNEARRQHAGATVQERELHAKQPLPKCCTGKNASKAVEEYSLYTWVRKQNLDKGLAPHNNLVLKERLRSSSPGAVKHPNLTTSSGIQWCRRFRRRWKISLGRIGCRDTISIEEAREKARSRNHAKRVAAMTPTFR